MKESYPVYDFKGELLTHMEVDISQLTSLDCFDPSSLGFTLSSIPEALGKLFYIRDGLIRVIAKMEGKRDRLKAELYLNYKTMAQSEKAVNAYVCLEKEVVNKDDHIEELAYFLNRVKSKITNLNKALEVARTEAATQRKFVHLPDPQVS